MRSVRTTFHILEAVADHQPIGLSELARRLEIPKSTVQRSLATLSDIGWIRPDGHDSIRWKLGERVRRLSEKVDDLGRLRDAAMPALDHLNADTLETIHLAVPEARTMRLVERMDSKHPLRLVQPIGSRSPLHAASTGKAVLAYLTETELEAYIQAGLPSVTGRTITEPDALRRELSTVRQRGYAVTNGELTDGISSIAASIRPTAGGRPVASISISGPSSRILPSVQSNYGELVARAAAEVSARY
jgi:IclR family acetate operon transcriptional repressor